MPDPNYPVFYCTTDHMHPYECDGPGKCVHCDREYRLEVNHLEQEREHDPATCELCKDGHAE